MLEKQTHSHNEQTHLYWLNQQFQAQYQDPREVHPPWTVPIDGSNPVYNHFKIAAIFSVNLESNKCGISNI